MFAKCGNASVLRALVGLLRDTATDVCIRCTGAGIEFFVLNDMSTVALRLWLPAAFFKLYSCTEPDQIEIFASDLYNALDGAAAAVVLQTTHVEDASRLVVHAETDVLLPAAAAAAPLRRPQFPPPSHSDATLSMPSKRWCAVVKQLTMLGDDICITTHRNVFSFATRADALSSMVTVATDRLHGAPITCRVVSAYLRATLKGAGLAAGVDLSISSTNPARVHLRLRDAGATATFHIAPRHDI